MTHSISIVQRLKHLFCCCLLGWLLPMAAARGQVGVTTQITVVPPFAPNFLEYKTQPGKLLVTVTNPGSAPRRVRFRIRLEGDNGVVVQTRPNFEPPQWFTLPAGATRIVTPQNELRPYFEEAAWQFAGTNLAQLRTQGLPEGMYSVCVFALEAPSLSYARTSAENLNDPAAQAGCYQGMLVRQAEPPVVISPLCESSVDLPASSLAVQNVVFSWSAAIGAPVGTTYNLRIVELPTPKANANAYIDAVALPFYEVRNLSTTSLLYNNAMPRLMPGKTYALRVQATGPRGSTLGFVNAGKSPVCTFKYGSGASAAAAAVAQAPIRLVIPTDEKRLDTVNVNKHKPFYVLWKPVEGTFTQQKGNLPLDTVLRISKPLYYRATIRALPARTGQPTGPELIRVEGVNTLYHIRAAKNTPLLNGKLYEMYVEAFTFDSVRIAGRGTFIQVGRKVADSKRQPFRYLVLPDSVILEEKKTLAGVIQYRYDGFTETYPYTNTFTLTKAYRIVDTTGADMVVFPFNIGVDQLNPTEKATIAQVKPNAQGKFTVTFKTHVPQPQEIAALKAKYNKSAPRYVVQAYYEIFHNNPYFNPPYSFLRDKITFQTNTLDIGQYLMTVKSYSLTLNLRKGYDQGSNGAPNIRVVEGLKNCRVTIYRTSKQALLPAMEGDSLFPKPKSGNRTIVATALSTIVLNKQNVPEAVAFFERLVAVAYDQPDPSTYYFIEIRKPDVFITDPFTKKTAPFPGEVIIDRPYRFKHPALANPGETTVLLSAYTSYESYTNVSPTFNRVNKTLTWTVTDPPRATLSGRMMYKYPDGAGGARPLAGKTVSLKAYYYLENKGNGNDQVWRTVPYLVTQSGNGVEGTKGEYLGEKGQVFHDDQFGSRKPYNYYYETHFGNDAAGKAAFGQFVDKTKSGIKLPEGTIATTTTDESGRFKFNKVALWDSVRAFPSEVTIARYEQRVPDLFGGNLPPYEQTDGGTYRVKMTYRVVVNDNRYCSPDDNVDINPLETKGDSTNVLYALVKSINVHVESLSNSKEISNVPVLIARAATAYTPPQGAGQQTGNLDAKPAQYTPNGLLILDQTFDSKGYTFKHIPGILKKSSDAYYFKTALNDTARGLYALVNQEVFRQDKSCKSCSILDCQYDDICVGGTEDLYNYGDWRDLLIEDKLQFNNEYQEKTAVVRFRLQAKNPIVTGRVTNSDGLTGVKGASIFLYDANGAYQGYKSTDKEGYFFFDNLGVGKKWRLIASRAGYTINTPDKTTGTLAKGDKEFVSFVMDPGTYVYGFVKDAAGKNIPSLVQVAETGVTTQTIETPCPPSSNQSANQATTPASFEVGGFRFTKVADQFEVKPIDELKLRKLDPFFVDILLSPCPQLFLTRVPDLGGRKIKIIPNDLKYFEQEVVVPNLDGKDELIDLGNVVVTTREHRMEFFISQKYVNPISGSVSISPLKNARIRLLDTTLVTDTYGRVRYHFFNVTQNNFWARISPPAGVNLVEQSPTLTNDESTGYQTYQYVLQPGLEVSGKVTLGGNPLPNATVGQTNGLGQGIISVKTNARGYYKIAGIPVSGSITLFAQGPTGASPTVIGASRMVPIKAGTATVADFDLTTFGQMNVSKLLGFDVVVESIQLNHGVYVSGVLKLDNLDNNLSLYYPNARVPFQSVKIKPNTLGLKDAKGIPYAEPEGNLVISNPYLKVVLGKEYNLELSRPVTQSGQFQGSLVVKKTGPLSGELVSRAALKDNSFDMPSTYLDFEQQDFFFASAPNLNQPLPARNLVTVFGRGQTAYTNPNVNGYSLFDAKMHLTSPKGDTIRFKFAEFAAKTAPDQTYIQQGKIRLLPQLTANIAGLGQLPFQLPAVVITSQNIPRIRGKEPLLIPLEKWTIAVPNWTFTPEEGGFVYTNKGEKPSIKTGLINIPFGTFRLRSNEMFIDQVNLNSLNLAGVATLQLGSQVKTAFGLDSKTGYDLKPHYTLRLLSQNNGSPVASADLKITGQTENYFSQPLQFEAISLISNGEQFLDIAPNFSTVRVQNILDFTPSQISVGASAASGLTIAGDLRYGIPRLANTPAKFFFRRASPSSVNIIARMQLPAVELATGKGNVVFKAKGGEYNLLRNNFVLTGTVEEPGSLTPLQASLQKSTTGTSIRDNGEQPLVLGSGTSIRVTDVIQQVPSASNEWDYLRFKGRMAGGNFGQLQAPMDFTIFGDIRAENKSLKVDQLTTPLGAMKLVFDLPKKSLYGSLQMDAELAEGIGCVGAAEMLIDPQGFYASLAGSVSVASIPIISPFKAGVLVGYYGGTLPQEIYQRTMQFNYHQQLPCSYAGLKGFLVCGRKDIIDPINLGVALPPAPLPSVLSVDFSLEAGVDASFLLNFGTSNPTAYFTAGVFGRSFLQLESGLSCTQLFFENKVEATATFQYIGSQLSGKAYSGYSMTGKFKQKLPLLFGCGPTLVSFSQGVNAYAEIGFKGKNPYVNFGLGKVDNVSCIPAPQATTVSQNK